MRDARSWMALTWCRVATIYNHVANQIVVDVAVLVEPLIAKKGAIAILAIANIVAVGADGVERGSKGGAGGGEEGFGRLAKPNGLLVEASADDGDILGVGTN